MSQSPDSAKSQAATSTAELPEAKPLDADGVTVFVLGTVVFAIASVVAILMRSTLIDNGNDWWVWVCIAGTGVGLLGCAYSIRRSKVYREAREASND